MTAVLYTNHFIQFFDDNGNPLSGGKLYAYSAGTTTPKATFTTESANVKNSHPVVLDSSGRATVFIQGSYRFDLFDSNDVLIKSTDDVTSFTTLNESGDPFFQSFSGTNSQTVFTLSESLGTDSKDIIVFVDGGGNEGYEIQNPSAYTLSGTSLTFNSAPASGTDNIYVFAPTKLLGAASAAAAAAFASEAAAAASATDSSDSADLSEEWAIKIDGIVDATDYSSKAWSIGGTGVTNGDGAAKEWATKVEDSTVDGSEFSAKHYAAKAQEYTQRYIGTSTTSLAIGTGSKVFVTQQNKNFDVGVWVLATSDADETNYMHGQVTAYSGTSLTVDVTNIGGSGTLADWTITVSGTQGSQGVAGTVSATSAVVAATTAGASLQSSSLNNCISWGSGGSANSTLGGNMSGASTHKLVNMADPTDAQDYATKNYVDNNAGITLQDVYPVGSIYMNRSVSTNPATLFGFGTWTARGVGRTIRGHDGSTYTAGSTGGSDTASLSSSNNAAHSHVFDTVGAAGSPFSTAVGGAANNNNAGTTEVSGSGSSFSIVNAYDVFYIWERTA